MRGLARWSAESPVAANVLMLLILVGGVFSMMQMRRELFPEFSLDLIVVSVPYLGASPEEIEEGICIKIEEEIESIDGIKQVESSADENVGSVVAELDSDADPDKVYDEIRNAIDQIDTFPEEAEEPIIEALTLREPAIFLVIYGEAEERVLRRVAEDIRDDLIALPAISQAQVAGTRNPEISIEIDEAALRRYGLTFDEVTAAVRRGSLDLPAGRLKTDAGDILVRAKGQRYTGREFESIPLITQGDGTIIRLGEVARIVDGFEDSDNYIRCQGRRAVIVQVLKTPSEDVIEIDNAVKQYVREHSEMIPEGLTMVTTYDTARIVRDRIDLLLRNGAQGLVLVFLALWLFLRLRLAFWVMMGIPISFMGGLILLYGADATINMISLFAFIMTLGIVVDDAIIVGENIYARYAGGATPFDAAVEGAAEVGWPVVVSVVTTMVAFCPLLFVSGIMGKFIAIMPVAVIATLAVSLVEAFLILPAHVEHSLRGRGRSSVDMGWRARMTRWIVDHIYAPYVIRPALAWRYVTVAVAGAAVVISMAVLAFGHLPFTVFPKVDGDVIIAELRFPEGTPVSRTERAVARMEAAGRAAAEEFRQAELRKPESRRGFDTEAGLVKTMVSYVGEITRKGSVAGASGSNVAEIVIELSPSEERNVSSTRMMQRWRELTGSITGVDQLTFMGMQAGPGGAPIEVRLLGRDLTELEAAAEALKAKLSSFSGVFDIRDDFVPGKFEMKIDARPAARTLGLTLGDIARQVRQGFYGDEAVRIQRGRDDVKVMIRYPADERRARSDVENMRIRTADGREVPFAEVAQVTFGRGYSTIRRIDRERAVVVTADLDEATANAQQILSELKYGEAGPRGPRTREGFGEGAYFAALVERFPGVSIDLGGQAQQTQESVQSLLIGFAYALIAIYCLLAAQFRSYSQPLIIMFAIPVALTGVIAGHMLMGRQLTLISLFGVVALSGVVVNDSLVLIDFINRRVRDGMEVFEAVIDAGRARLRAILLTTLTTVAGLTPLLFERSLQAQFLIPMAISLAFGLMAATLLTLVVTPCLYMILSDVQGLFGAVSEWRAGGRVAHAPGDVDDADDAEADPAPQTRH